MFPEVGKIVDDDWQAQARAAGWAPVPKSRLRVLDCKHPPGDTCGAECSRLLTPEEVAEVAERFAMYCEDMHLGYIYLWSGLKVILVEGEDEPTK